MLDAFIIEELRRREEREHNRTEQPRLELPLDNPREPMPKPGRARRDEGEADSERGVIILDFRAGR